MAFCPTLDRPWLAQMVWPGASYPCNRLSFSFPIRVLCLPIRPSPHLPNSTLLPTGASTSTIKFATRIHSSKLAPAYTGHQLRPSAWLTASRVLRCVKGATGQDCWQTVATHTYPAAEQAKQAHSAQRKNTQYGRRKDDSFNRMMLVFTIHMILSR